MAAWQVARVFAALAVQHKSRYGLATGQQVKTLRTNVWFAANRRQKEVGTAGRIIA